MFYFVKSSWLMRQLYSNCIWRINTTQKELYLTFDDGPHPVITGKVLDELKKYNAKATFFCIGKNVVANPDMYRRIIEEGHAVGNHTHHHLNGWKTKDKQYLDDIAMAKQYIDSNLFRPPYGRIGFFQLKQLALPRFNLKTIMWTVLSGDFDKAISKEQCLENVLLNAAEGSIIVLHDSEKAEERMLHALTGTLSYFAERGYVFKKIESVLL